MTAGASAAEAIVARKAELGRKVTDALYRERPELLDRYGERGRHKCLEDMQHNFEFLAPAVGLGEPSLFVQYVRWLDELLRARDVDTAHVVRSLELMMTVLDAELPPAEAAAACDVLRAGLIELAGVSP